MFQSNPGAVDGPITRRFWVFDWLEENDLRTEADVSSCLTDWRAFEQLRDRAASAELIQPVKSGVDTSILAGRGLDLSGYCTCPNPDCRRAEVDELFRSVWHYFDRIVLADEITCQIVTSWKSPNQEKVDWFTSQVSPLLYLLEIGADRLVEFVHKTPTSPWQTDQLQSPRARSLVQAATEFATTLFAESELVRESFDDDVVISLSHPDLPTRMGMGFPRATAPRRSQRLKRMITGWTVTEIAEQLYCDLTAAANLGLPLGAAVPEYPFLLSRMQALPTVADVAFRIRLPYVTGLSAREIVQIRNAERDSFERFQSALREAIREAMRQRPESNADRIARELQQDLIEPELRRIRDSLNVAVRGFAKRSMIGIGVSFSAALCGLAAGAPLPVAVPAAATGMALGIKDAFNNYSKTTDELSLSDLWFVWKAHNAASRRRR